MTTFDYLIVLAYIAAMMWLGFAFRGQKSLKEFFLGDRNIPWWAAAFSGIATVVSAASYLGGPGQAYKANWTFLQYRLAMPVAIAVICWLLIPFFYRLDVFTAYEYLERRFDLKTRLVASGLFLLLKCFYLGIVIYAPTLFVQQMTGLSAVWIVVAIGLLTTIYTCLGGMRAVIWTDAIQLFILLGGLVAATYVLLQRIDGGFSTVIAVAQQHNKLQFFDFSTSLTSEATFWGGIFGGTFFILSTYGVDQAELQRFLTTSSLRKSQLSIVSSMFFITLLGFFLFFIGTALYVFYLQFPAKGGIGINPDRAFPKFIIEELPAGVKGLVTAGVFSAAMSTISGVLNSLTTVTVLDFYQRLSTREVSVRMAKWMTVAFGLLCTVIALFSDRLGNLIIATSKVTNFFSGTLVGVFLLGMLVRRANATGALGGMFAGFLGVGLVSALTPVSWLWYGLISAVLAFGGGMVISLYTAPPAPEKLAGLTVEKMTTPLPAETPLFPKKGANF